jgi:hypothetical protein
MSGPNAELQAALTQFSDQPGNKMTGDVMVSKA